MKKFIRKTAALLPLLFLWTTIHGFQWRQHPRPRKSPSKIPVSSNHPQVSPRKLHHRDDDSNDMLPQRWQRLSFSSVPRALISPIQSFSRLFAITTSNTSVSSSDGNEDVLDFVNQTQGELLAEADALWAKARAIRKEAEAMEAALQDTTSKRLKAKQAEVDGIIATLFSSKLSVSKSASTASTRSEVNHNQTSALAADTETVIATPDARVVADRVQNGRYSQEQLLAVVDRLFNLQALAMGQVTTQTAAAIPPFPAERYDIVIQNETASEQYGDYLEALTQAANILDDGSAALQDQVSYSMPSPSASASPVPTPTASSTVSSSRDIGSGRLELAVRTRIKELCKTQGLNKNRLVAAEISKVVSAARNGTVEEYIRQTFGADEDDEQASSKRKDMFDNTKAILKNITTTTSESAAVPIWVPSTLLPFIVACNNTTIGPTEIKLIEKEVLLGSRFFLTKTESVPGAALFRGNIRKPPVLDNDKKGWAVFDNTTAAVFAELQERLDSAGLGNRVQLFLMPDLDSEPRMKGTRPAVAAMEEQAKPVLLAISKAVTPDESLIKKRWIAKEVNDWSSAFTAMSIFCYSVSVHALNPNFFSALVRRRDLSVLKNCIPVALGTIILQTIHEAAHYLVAKKKQIKIGLPVPIPSLHLTTIPFFGCITPLRSFPKNRAALLDFALSGPLSAITVSLALVVSGTLLTVRASPYQLAKFPVMSVAYMKSSFLLGSILSWLAPKTMMLPLAQPVPMHPFFVVGASGLICNALNLLPIFRLDGGRASFAAMGQRQGAVISVFTLLLMVSMVLSGASSIFMLWTFLIAALQRRQEIPPLDDVTEVDGKRLTLWLLSFLLSASILAPFPGYNLLAL